MVIVNRQILVTVALLLAGCTLRETSAALATDCPLPVSPPAAVCSPSAPSSSPTAEASAVALQNLIDDVPSVQSGQVVVHATDNRGDQLGALDPIPDPAGGYLGVYHSPYRALGRWTFRISLAHSSDLLHWTRIRVLDRRGASMPTLRQIPGTDGFLLAYEKALPGGDVIRIAYYGSRADLLSGQPGARRNLPRSLSRYNDGTPTILSIDWNGSAARSLIQLGFHYQTRAHRHPAADREAIAALAGFRRWTAHRDLDADAALSAEGFHGNHGDWREFAFDGFRWRVYEGQRRYDNFSTWHVLLYNPSSRATYPLSLQLDGSRITSLGNPIVQQETAPGGQGQVLVVTTFVFAASDPALTGELVYYQPT